MTAIAAAPGPGHQAPGEPVRVVLRRQGAQETAGGGGDRGHVPPGREEWQL